MNEPYEQEIDLKWLLYRIFRAWRPIVLWTILLALVIGLLTLGFNLYRLSDPEYVEETKTQFARKHAGWVSTGENLRISMDNLQYKKTK